MHLGIHTEGERKLHTKNCVRLSIRQSLCGGNYPGYLHLCTATGGWRFTRFPERLNPSLDWLQAWDGDGAFVIVSPSSDAQVARRLPYPVVNISAYLPDSAVPTVTMNHHEVGRLAATHLLERRFRKFGYYGSDELWFSQLRRKGFESAIERAGGTCNALDVSSTITSGKVLVQQQIKLERWGTSMKPPVGIMASTDLRAGMLLETCARLGLRVPDDIAVIGVDDDPVVCGYSQPPLSSVARNDTRAGEIAARFLDDLMARKPNPPKLITVPPVGVGARRSTDTVAVEDSELAALVRYVRDHVSEQFG